MCAANPCPVNNVANHYIQRGGSELITFNSNIPRGGMRIKANKTKNKGKNFFHAKQFLYLEKGYHLPIEERHEKVAQNMKDYCSILLYFLKKNLFEKLARYLHYEGWVVF